MGRSALHYAAALDDDREIYKILVASGATSGPDKVCTALCDAVKLNFNPNLQYDMARI